MFEDFEEEDHFGNTPDEKVEYFNTLILKYNDEDKTLLQRTFSDVVIAEKMRTWFQQNVLSIRQSYAHILFNTDNDIVYDMSMKEYSRTLFAIEHDNKTKNSKSYWIYTIDFKTGNLTKHKSNELGEKQVSAEELLMDLGIVETPVENESLEDVLKKKQETFELEMKEKKQKILSTKAGQNILSLADALKNHDYLLTEEEKTEKDKVAVGSLLKDLGLE